MADVKFTPRTNASEQFLRWLFKSPTGPIKITREHDLGKFFMSLYRYSEEPKESAGIDIDFGSIQSIKFHWCYYTADDQRKINDAIDSYMTLDLMYFILEQKANGREYKDIYVDYVVSRKLEFDDKILDMIKKRDYRFRKKATL